MNMIKNFIIISIIITNLFSNSLSDAFVKVAEIANPAVVSILGTQNVEKSFKLAFEHSIVVVACFYRNTLNVISLMHI